MPVTRSVGRRTASATVTTDTTTEVTGTSGTTTEVTGTSGTTTEATGTTDTSGTATATATATERSTAVLRTPPASRPAPEDQKSIVAEHRKSPSRSQARSTRSKNPSRTRRLAQAKAELVQLKIELATARIAEIEAESDEDDMSSVVTEAEQKQRVHSWLENSRLLAIDSQPHQATEAHIVTQPPAEPAAPAITVASWDTPASAPAGVTAAPPPLLRLSAIEPSTSHSHPHPQPATSTEGPPTALPVHTTGAEPPGNIAAWESNLGPAQPPTPVITAASWRPNLGTAQPPPPVTTAVSWQSNLGTAQPPTPVITTASWRPNFGTAQPPPPVTTAVSWQSNIGFAPPPPPVITAASWQPNFGAAQPQQVNHPTEDGAVTVRQSRTDLLELASAITSAVQAAQHRQPLKYTELPSFNGAHQDWLTYRAAYLETAHHFTSIENMSRLRRSLRGTAKEAVQGLLITNADPNNVMKTLEMRFGRPDSIAMAEIDRLRTLPRLTESPRELCTFATKVENTIGTLQALNCIFYLYNPEVTKNMTEKLTPTLKRQWYEFAATQPKEEPDLLKFGRFIQREAEMCSPFAQPEPITERSLSKTNTEGQRRQRVHTVSENYKSNCGLCSQQGHSIVECTRFKDASTDARWDIAKKHRLCFRCLRFRSKQHSCKPKKCETDGCIHLHHKLLHSVKKQIKKEENPEPKEDEHVNSAWTPKVSFLKIVPVHISGPAGAADTLALLDDGSTVTLIDEELAKKIGADGPDEPLHIITYNGESGSDLQSRRVNFQIRGANRHQDRIQARTVNDLKLAAQRVPKEAIEECEHLKSILAEIQPSEAAPKILIGQDNWHLLLATDVRTGRRNQPVASLTPLGWVVHGGHTRTLGHRVNFVKHITTDDHLEEMIREFITMDNLYIDPRRPASDPGEKALRILEKRTKKTPEGRYQTALLWKSEDVVMPNNYDNTLRRLHTIERKLDQNPQLKQKYNEQMEALVTKGYAEPAPPTSNKRTWYLPHFAVFNPMKPDKLRVVHDAAAKTRGTSLNDQLLTGPDLLQPLPGVIMKFRQHPIAVTADITEMFMQVELQEQDRDALRYLWRGDRRDDHPPQQYRMKSLIFGASSSPATAIFVMNLNAEKHRHEHPEAVEAIRNKHYMDDYLDSFESLEQAAKVTRQVRDIHREAKFELKKWTSNSAELLQTLDEVTELEPTVDLKGAEKTERVLGLIWQPKNDRLAFNLDLARIPSAILNNATPTKRQALKIVMSLFDPLGLVSPITIRAKQILQEVWRRGTAWDENIDDDLAADWTKWLVELRSLSAVSIPRSYPSYSAAVSLQLHVFTDASESAYATALYWRAVDDQGRVSVTLVTAKAKVAPLKVTSIPRMELQAAVLGSRMATAVKDAHERKPDATVYWTDSRTTLTWIRTGSRSYKAYVAHRVAAIEEHSKSSEWRWVPTKSNVADDATRDVPDDFHQGHRWFNGPDFLQKGPESWPADNRSTVTPTGEERTYAVIGGQRPRSLNAALPDVNRFSKWSRYLRATARILHAIEVFKQAIKQRVNHKRTARNRTRDPNWQYAKNTTRPLKTVKVFTNDDRYLYLPAELQRRAEALIWQASQEDSFQKEVEELKKGNQVPRDSRLYKLSVELSDQQLRLKSRIGAALEVSDELKNPLVIDGDHRATRLWIEHEHRRLHHAGAEATTNECRQRHWILRLRPTVKNIIRQCVRCRMRTASPPQPMTGDLPHGRLAHHQRPFTYTGLDYFGPLSITVGRTHQKRYVALFTCLTTRAIHLELVQSLSADSAVMALRRMIARRGVPKQIWSDNGTNFHGAEKELRHALFTATEKEASRKIIDWRFIPPGAPFMGGAWERMVRSVKTALATVLHERHPAEEVLHTLLAEAEHTVNSRPLTHVSVDPEDPEALTPNHFLLGGPGGNTAPGTFNDRDLNLRSSWRASQRLADMFWSRWLKEYLPELRNRRDPHGKGPEIQVGDLVQIIDGNLPRNMWIRGRIHATHPGPDGIVRAVDVVTRGGILRRPTKKLILLPMEKADPVPN